VSGGGPTRELADVLARTKYADLPSATIEHTRRAVLDWLASALAGSIEPPARMAQRIAAGFGASSEAMVFGASRASAAAAAFANGVASHILELDDIHKGSTVHGAAPIIPAALAVAEREHATGAAFLTAVTVGYEAAFRIGEAVNPSHYRFWHPTGTVATFGAAAAAGVLVGLNSDQMVDALGTAGTQAAGLWEFNADGAMSKHLHPGKAAMNGVMAADLARAGFTGASRILEGERGFMRAMSSAREWSRIGDGLGAHWTIGENGFKLHACCGHTHSAIDLAIGLRERRGWCAADVLEHVRTVDVDTYGPGYEIVKDANPRSPYHGKFSMAYCVAVGLLEGQAGLEQFAEDRFGRAGVREPSIAALLSRTRVSVADDLTAKYPAAWPARVALTLADGSRLCDASDYPRGNPENPVSTAALERKLRDLVTPRFGAATSDRALAIVGALPATRDVSWLFRAFAETTKTR
jgi:2-methylcitrate dehydratase PrpD